MSINNCTFTGRIGKDAETRFTPSQKAITSFSLAVDIGWGDNKKTLWLRCNGWGDRFTKLSEYLTKGQQVGVCGEVSLNEWDGDKGKMTSLELNVREIELLGGKSESRSESGTKSEQTQRTKSEQSFRQQPAADEFQDQDIPF